METKIFYNAVNPSPLQLFDLVDSSHLISMKH